MSFKGTNDKGQIWLAGRKMANTVNSDNPEFSLAYLVWGRGGGWDQKGPRGGVLAIAGKGNIFRDSPLGREAIGRTTASRTRRGWHHQVRGCVFLV